MRGVCLLLGRLCREYIACQERESEFSKLALKLHHYYDLENNILKKTDFNSKVYGTKTVFKVPFTFNISVVFSRHSDCTPVNAFSDAPLSLPAARM